MCLLRKCIISSLAITIQPKKAVTFAHIAAELSAFSERKKFAIIANTTIIGKPTRKYFITHSLKVKLAPVEGIEPPLTVLETVALPLYYTGIIN
jgi:hypothetical protein